LDDIRCCQVPWPAVPVWCVYSTVDPPEFVAYYLRTLLHFLLMHEPTAANPRLYSVLNGGLTPVSTISGECRFLRSLLPPLDYDIEHMVTCNCNHGDSFSRR
jgi:hypothetical protein